MSRNESHETVAKPRLNEDTLIDHEGRRALYEYVRENGPIHRDELRRTVFPHDRRAFEHHLALLEQKGYLTEADKHVERRIDRERLGATDPTTVSTNKTQVPIRPACPNDRTELLDVIRQVAGDQTHIEAESVAITVDAEARIFRDDAHETRVFFVATTDDALVGWVHLTTPTLDKRQHTATLTVGVVDSHRNRGIGSRLLQTGGNWATEQGFETIYQRLPASNTDAVEFLEAHGRELEAVRSDHYQIDGAYVDEMQMATEVS